MNHDVDTMSSINIWVVAFQYLDFAISIFGVCRFDNYLGLRYQYFCTQALSALITVNSPGEGLKCASRDPKPFAGLGILNPKMSKFISILKFQYSEIALQLFYFIFWYFAISIYCFNIALKLVFHFNEILKRFFCVSKKHQELHV